MGLISRVKGLWDIANTDKHIDELVENSQLEGVQWREATPSFPIYPESLLNGTFIGISDQDYITEREQRMAWRGVFSACVQMRADEIADALCRAEIKRKIGDKEFEDVEPDHPWKQLWENPSKGYDKWFFFEQMSKLRDFGRGSHLAVLRGELQVPEKLQIVYPYFGDIRVQGNIEGSIQEYIFTAHGGAVQHIPVTELLWMRHGHPVTPYESSSLLMRGMFESDISLFQSVYMRDMSKEGNIPSVYASSDQHISEKQAEEFGRRLTKDYRTAGRANKKTLVLGKGTKLETIAMSPDEMQAIDSIGLNNSQIYIICGFPPEMFAENGTLANSKEGRLKWLQNSIQKEVNKICHSFTHQLKVAFDAMESDLCIVPPDVVPKDLMEQQRIREVQIRTGQRTANEFRMEDGMEEYPEGELFFIGGGVRPVQDLIHEESDEQNEQKDDTDNQ